MNFDTKYPNISNIKLLLALGYKPVVLESVALGGKDDFYMTLRIKNKNVSNMISLRVSAHSGSKNAEFSTVKVLQHVESVLKFENGFKPNTVDKLKSLVDLTDKTMVDKKLENGVFVNQINNIILPTLSKDLFSEMARIDANRQLSSLVHKFASEKEIDKNNDAYKSLQDAVNFILSPSTTQSKVVDYGQESVR